MYERFNPDDWLAPQQLNGCELAILIDAWHGMDLSCLPGYPIWEQSVFELLAQCVAPCVGIFGYYCRSSLENQKTAGLVELSGWKDFIADCNVITKSFSGVRADEVRHSPSKGVRLLEHCLT